MEHFRPPEPFSFEGTNVADRWRRWEKQFKNYFFANEISKKAKKVQVPILLHCAGPEAQEVHEQFVFGEGVAWMIMKSCSGNSRITVSQGKIQFTRGIDSGAEIKVRMNQLTNGSRNCA